MEYNDEFPKAPAEYSFGIMKENLIISAYENRYRKALCCGVVCWGSYAR